MGFFTVPNTQPYAQEHAGRVRADLSNNASYRTWSAGGADILADPHKFGIDYLPKGAWINKRGEVVTTDTGIPTAAWAIPASLATFGVASALAPTAAATAGASGALPATVPGSYASTAYGAGMFTAPSATSAAMAAAPAAGASAGTGAGMKFGLGTLAKFFNSRGGAEAVNAAGQLVGGAMQARAGNHAADLQARSAQQALDFAKQQYAEAVKNYAPFLQASQQAIPQLTDFMGQMRPPQGGYPVNGSQPGGPQPGAPAGGAPKFVMMRSPTGETRAVMPESVPKYLGRGMTVVG